MTGGFAIGTGPCYVHGGMFEFDAMTVCTTYVRPDPDGPGDVPATPDDPGARQVQICDDCIEHKVNPVRVRAGEPPFELARDRLGEWPPGWEQQ